LESKDATYKHLMRAVQRERAQHCRGIESAGILPVGQDDSLYNELLMSFTQRYCRSTWEGLGQAQSFPAARDDKLFY